MKDILPRQVRKLIEELAKLPGIGPKSASRLVFYLLARPKTRTNELGQAISNLKDNLKKCRECFNISESNLCPICEDESRNKNLIMVVETALDVIALEKSRDYSGVYHILGGVIKPIEGIGPDELHLKELLDRIKDNDEIEEIILATNPNLEGEATAMYLAKKISDLAEKSARKILVTRIARGLPVGADLEYADEVTLSRALEGRREYQ
ncbi:MAG: recombination protein RecR [Candidatus Berkelbacteria bacterium Licking1014_96]|uniref:Recombination protein RecR n=1 Tax=Candidatus Berkelbacteria bacterium Licking1014_96 TaxID=2017149 RepID=A0A554LG39_9BACT|nr:MAG: recombination protein RecR [Candidatus Berkelbacteria bacterium Licking1014_96]